MASTSVVLGGMSRPYRRPVVLGVTLVLSVVALARFGILLTILVMVIGVTAAVLVGRHQAGLFTVRKKGARATGWRPTVQHQELPTPTDDPVIAFPAPVLGCGHPTPSPSSGSRRPWSGGCCPISSPASPADQRTSKSACCCLTHWPRRFTCG